VAIANLSSIELSIHTFPSPPLPSTEHPHRSSAMPRKVQVELTLPERKSLRAVLSIAMLFLAVALALNVVATISLPQIPNLDIAYVSLPQGNDTTATNNTLLPDVTKIQVR
jgi:hypothetical protein